MSLYKMTLGQLVRETKTVYVEAPTMALAADQCAKIWELDDGAGWNSDDAWGCEPSDENSVEPVPEVPEGSWVDFQIFESGTVLAVPKEEKL